MKQGVEDALPGAVIGHLTAAIALHHGHGGGCDEVLPQSGLPEGNDRGVFAQPDLIGLVGLTRAGPISHFRLRGKVGQRLGVVSDD